MDGHEGRPAIDHPESDIMKTGVSKAEEKRLLDRRGTRLGRADMENEILQVHQTFRFSM
jgi:hypothetical protein